MHRRRTIAWTAYARLLLIACTPVTALAATPTASPVPSSRPDVRSSAFYVFDESNASVLAARNERLALPVASITKLMTALVVLDAAQPLDEMLTVTADDVRGTVGNHSRLAKGTRLSREDFMRLALMSSENRAAHVLCRSYPRGLVACVQAMNKKAAELHMATARFVEPTGLSSRNVASAVDLSKLVIAAAAHETIRKYSTTPRHQVTVNRQQLEFRTTNLLVENPTWQVDVQKTGYIGAAGRCLVMQTAIDGRSVVIVLLNSYGKYTRIADARRIRTWMESRNRIASLQRPSTENAASTLPGMWK